MKAVAPIKRQGVQSSNSSRFCFARLVSMATGLSLRAFRVDFDMVRPCSGAQGADEMVGSGLSGLTMEIVSGALEEEVVAQK